MDQRHTAHPGCRAEPGQHVACDGTNLGGSGTVRRREAAERVGEGAPPCAASAGTAGGGDRAERPDCGAGHEEGDHEPGDKPEGCLGIVEQPAAGDQGRRTARPAGHEPRARGGEPRSGEHEPHHQEHEAREQLEKLAADGARLARSVEVRQHGDADEQRDDPHDPRWAGRRSPLHAERRYLDPAKREACGHDRGDRDADHGEHDVGPVQREVACREGRSGERHVVEQRPEDEEEREPGGDARDRRDHCLYRGDHRNLPRCGADEAHRGEALLAPRGRQPARGRDQDQHRQQERDGPASQDELQNGSAPEGALAGVAISRRAPDGPDLGRTRHPGELARGVPDDDDQRVRGRQRRRADGPDLATRIPVAQLIRRLGPEQGREGGRGEVLTRSWQVRKPGRDRSARPGRGHVDPVDRLVAELVEAGQPPQPAGCRGRS